MRSLKKGVATEAVRQIAPKIPVIAPRLTSAFIQQALARAIEGVGPLPPAAEAAEEQLREQRGDVDKGVHEVVENHVRYALAEGFATNLGGLVTAAVLAPANITGLALIQCRMVAGILHLRGYDLDDPAVRNAILVTLLGEGTVRTMVKDHRLPAGPMALATTADHRGDLDEYVVHAVAAEMIARVAGKRLALTIGKRTPVVGGLIGAGTDGYVTWQIGRYADREFLPVTSA